MDWYFAKPERKHHDFVYLVMSTSQKMLHYAFECSVLRNYSLLISPVDIHRTTTATLSRSRDAPLGARLRSNPNLSHRNYAAHSLGRDT